MRAKTRTIKVDTLARVEGEGSLLIRLEGGRAAQVELRIFEPPRFFEAFLRGRAQAEVPDITARICGICPVAYQMSSCHAIEDVAGVAVGGVLRALRRLLYCGEWVESHALHVFMLHAPDFLGYDDALAMAKDHPDVVRKGLRIKKAGNAIVAKLGGREIAFVQVDDESKPAAATDNMNRLVGREKVDVVVGTVHSGVAMAMVKVARDTGTLLIIPNAGANDATGPACAPNVFRSSFSNWQPNYPMGKVMFDAGHRNVATITWKYAAGIEHTAHGQ